MSRGIFTTGWATCSHTKKIKLKHFVLFLDEILSLKNKSCVIEKMPVTALRFACWHSYNNYVKMYPQALSFKTIISRINTFDIYQINQL